MTTPAGLIELMHHKVTIHRHYGIGAGEQIVTVIGDFPCYIDASKGDQSPPQLTAYLGVTDDAAPQVRQGDYMTFVDGTMAEWPKEWSLGAVQTWWDSDGGYWGQQAALDAPLVQCSIQEPNNQPDLEGRFVGWTQVCTFLGGVRSLSAFEQRRSAQVGEQVDVMFRYPAGIGLTRANRVVIETGPYVNTYEVVTVQPHDDACTAALRRYEPAGTPV
jgi:hypothetical protein